MPRKPGVRNRNYPSITLEKALAVATVIHDEAAGGTVRKLTLAQLLDTTPGSGKFKEIVIASNAYGLTEGGVNGDQFGLSPLGRSAVGASADRRSALRAAIMNIPPFGLFLRNYATKKMPNASVAKDFLVENAKVPEEWANDCLSSLIENARFVRLLTDYKGGSYISSEDDMISGESNDEDEGNQSPQHVDEGVVENKRYVDEQDINMNADPLKDSSASTGVADQLGKIGSKVFVAHGKNRGPLSELKAILDRFGVQYAIAVDEPNAGRPISAKVASLMRDECSSAIFIFTADELFLKKDEKGEDQEVWRPSENVIYELGAASVLYDRRIVIFKERTVSFPSDFSDLGYIVL